MVLGDMMMQMLDGIHEVARYMHVVDGKLGYDTPKNTRTGFEKELETVSCEVYLEYLESIGAPDSAYEQAYGEFNSFARTADGKEYYAWYNNLK